MVNYIPKTPYRWVVLASFMMLLMAQNIMWITFAPVTSKAAVFYKVSELEVGYLSMAFMITYLIIAIPATFIINKYGFKRGVTVGAVLTALFGLARGIFGDNYYAVLVFQVLVSFGQPFIANSVTTVAGRWFPVEERATASGLATLSGYIGVILGMMVTPELFTHFGIQKMLLIYGILGVACCLIFILLAKEKPLDAEVITSSNPKNSGINDIIISLRNKNFIILIVVFFIGIGVFNGIETWIENILNPKGLSVNDAGIIGGLIVISGILGALTIPYLSDRKKRRLPFILVSIAASIPGLAGITFSQNYWLILISSCIFGFFTLGLGPLGFQYATEITGEVPEAVSTGMLMMAGQLSGMLFSYFMDILKNPKTGSMTLPLCILTVFVLLEFALCTRLKESQAFNINQTYDNFLNKEM